MLVDADTAAEAVTSVFERVATATRSGWSQRRGGAFAWATGIDLPTLNGVIVESPEGVDAATVALFLDRLADSGLAHCVQARPPVAPWLVALAERRGLIVEEDLPLMAVGDSLQQRTIRPVDGWEVRLVSPGDRGMLAETAAAGFGGPVALFDDLVSRTCDLPGLRAYIGYIDGEAVGTAMGFALGDFVAIFTVSTRPGWRCRGVGTALTAHAVREGYTAGCHWSWLQSSSMGYGVYKRLGFVELERWVSWVAASGTR